MSSQIAEGQRGAGELKLYKFSDLKSQRMRKEEAATTTLPIDRYHLCFALGKALEDRQEFPDPGTITNKATR